MGAAGRRRALASFGWEGVARQLVRVYEDVLAERAATPLAAARVRRAAVAGTRRFRTGDTVTPLRPRRGR